MAEAAKASGQTGYHGNNQGKLMHGILRGPGLQVIMCSQCRHCRTSCPERMSSVSNAIDAAANRAFAAIPALLEQTPALIKRGRMLDCECLLGPTHHPFHASIRAGRIVDLTPAPVLMRSWRFSYRASPAAWAAYWQPEPRPGWHDLLALTKRGEAVLEGDLHPFMAHLQYFKDLLALPRSHFAVAVP